MRHLFLKIFVSVLLTLLLTFCMGFAIGLWLMPFSKLRPPGMPEPQGIQKWDLPFLTEAWRTRIADLLETHAHAVGNVLTNEGPDAAIQQMQRLSSSWEIQSYLLDEQGQELRGVELPPLPGRLADQAMTRDGLQRDGTDRTVALALRLHTADGRVFIFAAMIPQIPFPTPSTFAWLVVLRLVPLALGLGLVCYFLARYITDPVLKLRSALRSFGEGNLEQRVAPAIGKRRDEIGELARDFDHMAERIATLLGAQRRLLQDISHELRSPLARQRVAIELARQRQGEEADRALDRAEREAEQLHELISELLALTRLESAGNGQACVPVNLGDLLREVIENAQFEASSDTRSVRLMECNPCTVTGVPELLKRAIENVVRNALAYTADDTAVEASLVNNGTQAVLVIRDYGPGVPAAELEDIFRPFYRVSQARERQGGGVGLGLSIAVRAIHSHGGSITASNHHEGGLAVEIKLPC